MEVLAMEAFKTEELPKGHRLLSPYNFSQKVFYLEKGIARTYYLKDGKDITHSFIPEDSFFVSIESVFFRNPSPYGVEVLENSVVRTIVYQDLEKFIDGSQALQKLSRLVMMNAVKTFSDKLYSIQFQSAQERYNSMLEKFPDIMLRVPLGHIASYLGITQETLSRIRAGKI
ncbi:Crp/Fnr family transcriptional regulator [Dyadobacter sp. 676]|uniref:Crp/Fnr family transcriptional regulator n=1 Tax=Dyadobacter sp. 676 TaxID=3088362 RepID=A0AAU8FHC5_9BACT